VCSVVDLFDDGSLNEEVFAVAREIANASRGTDIDPMQVIDEAEKIVRTRDRFMVRLTGESAKFKAITYDPVGVSRILDIKLNRKYDLDKRGVNPASSAQLGMLRGLGMETPDGLSKWGASKMIDKIVKRRDKGFASVPQVKRLLEFGVNADLARSMSGKDASSAISEITSLRPVAQRMLF
jgi:hypothetical protein